jgi:hypothetical protein
METATRIGRSTSPASGWESGVGRSGRRRWGGGGWDSRREKWELESRSASPSRSQRWRDRGLAGLVPSGGVAEDGEVDERQREGGRGG